MRLQVVFGGLDLSEPTDSLVGVYTNYGVLSYNCTLQINYLHILILNHTVAQQFQFVWILYTLHLIISDVKRR